MPQGLSGLPLAVRTTIVMERLADNYAHVVVGVTGEIDETVIYMLERAAQAVLVVTPEQTAWDRLNTLRLRLKTAVHPEKTSLLVVCNRPDAKYRAVETPGTAHIDIPWIETMPPLEQRSSLPLGLSEAAITLANRLGRTNQIGIYIPAKEDARPYVDQTVAFLSKFFGSAAGYPTSSVSDKEPVGMAGDKIYLVQTYVTKIDMDRHLGDVLAYVEKLKTELGQEVMALEVNRNVMLV